MTNSNREDRLRLYLSTRNRAIEKKLGVGNDGEVWQTDKTTAVKVCDDEERYAKERNCYLLLGEKKITEICGFVVPRLIDYSDPLMIIEIDFVKPPYIIDFGKVYLHRAPPHFSQQTMADWYAEKKELYGEHWPTIRSILIRLRAIGIYHMDPKPGNIMPANWDPSLD